MMYPPRKVRHTLQEPTLFTKFTKLTNLPKRSNSVPKPKKNIFDGNEDKIINSNPKMSNPKMSNPKMGVVVDIPLHNITQPEIQDQTQDTGWTVENTNTILNWKTNLEKYTYIYTYISDYNRKKLHSYLIYSLIVSTMATLLSSITTALLSGEQLKDEEPNKDNLKINFYLSSILFLFNGINIILVGAVKIYKWDSVVNSLTIYIEKVNTFLYTVSYELLLPAKLRTEFNAFVTKQSSSFLDIMQNTPNIEQFTVLEEANREYEKYIIKK